MSDSIKLRPCLINYLINSMNCYWDKYVNAGLLLNNNRLRYACVSDMIYRFIE